MGVSPTKTGEMRQDQFWLLIPKRVWAYYDDNARCPVEPITTEQVPYEHYRTVGTPEFRQRSAAFRGIKIHGRRVNDEVELFEWDGGEETSGLREALEAKGLTVRTYQPEKKNKFPKATYKSVLGSDAELVTPFDKAVSNLKKRIAEEEEEKECTAVDYAILTDGDTRENTILVCAMSAEAFYRHYEDDLETITTRQDFKYRVIGTIDCREVRLSCSEERFMSFFKVKTSTTGEVSYEAKVKICDDVRASAEEAREAVKAGKKAAKRHRRRVTASTVTSPSEVSFASSLTECDEDINARRRERNKVKKKAQKERRLARQEELGKTVVAALKSDRQNKTDGGDESDKEINLQVLRDCGSYFVVRNQDTGGHRILPKKGHEIIDTSDLKEKKETPSRQSSPQKQISSGRSNVTINTDNGGGLQVVQIGENATPADITNVIQALAGSPIIVASPEEEPEERKSAVSKGLEYLGRGL